MSDVESSVAIRAPTSNGDVLVSPNSHLRTLVSANKRSQQSDFGVGGYNANSIRKVARAELLDFAENYTRQYAPNIFAPADPETIFVSGHQPEFFHPGVWFKNFLLFGLAKKHNGISVNLVIDNDECSSTSIRVPTGTLESPTVTDIAFDRTEKALPFENRNWSDPKIAKRFQSTVQNAFSVGQPSDLLLNHFWPNLLSVARFDRDENDLLRSQTLGRSVAQTRHQVELAHDVCNLELPLSQICRGKAFQQFLSAIFQSADRFHTTYNQAVLKFRVSNGIRSKTRPVPELVRNDQWIELPFWIWSRESPERGPLYIRCEKAEQNRCLIFLSDLDSIELQLRSDELVNELSSLNAEESKHGISIRPRALITTMFARLFLSDVFVHGIGGAKYDELTDEIIRDFFDIEPPAFLTVTSTNWLPIEFSPPKPDEMAHARQQIRETVFHPEKFKNGSEDFVNLANRKAELLSKIPEKRRRKRWHLEISEVNQQLSKLISAERIRAESRLKRLMELAENAKILCSREYSILLHPVSLIKTLSEQVDEVLSNSD